MNIVVTGSNGFLGKNLIRFINEKDNNLIIHKTIRHKDNNHFYFDLKKDFDENFLIKNKIKIIVHCAFSHDYFSLKEGLRNNVIISEKIFNFAKKNNIFVIYISSISANKEPKSNYGKIKREIEKKLIPINGIIIRPGLIYSNRDYNGIFGKIYKLVMLFPILPLINGGKNSQYMCKVESLCELIYVLIQNTKTHKKIYSAFNKNKISLREIVNTITNVNDKKRFLVPFPASIIIFLLYFSEFFRVNFRIKSDNVINFLYPSSKILYDENQFNINFPDFREDYKIEKSK